MQHQGTSIPCIIGTAPVLTPDPAVCCDLFCVALPRSALTPYEDTSCTSVAFDHSGLYLSVGGSDARIYGSKNDWSVIKTFPDVPKKGVTALRFSSLARQLLVGGADHNLRVFAAATPMET